MMVSVGMAVLPVAVACQFACPRPMGIMESMAMIPGEDRLADGLAADDARAIF